MHQAPVRGRGPDNGMVLLGSLHPEPWKGPAAPAHLLSALPEPQRHAWSTELRAAFRCVSLLTNNPMDTLSQKRTFTLPSPSPPLPAYPV